MHSHSQVLGVRSSICELWGDTTQPVTICFHYIINLIRRLEELTNLKFLTPLLFTKKNIRAMHAEIGLGQFTTLGNPCAVCVPQHLHL